MITMKVFNDEQTQKNYTVSIEHFYYQWKKEEELE